MYKHKKVSQRYLESFQTYLDTEQNATDYLVRHNELSSLIEKEIAGLPHKMREVFELSRKTNLSRKEIAAELNLSEQTVKSHMHHALKILKAKLGPMVIFVL
ncbi:RNA polymerase sigma factor [compost metagenome]